MLHLGTLHTLRVLRSPLNSTLGPIFFFACLYRYYANHFVIFSANFPANAALHFYKTYQLFISRLHSLKFIMPASLSIVLVSTALIGQSFFRASVRLARLTTSSLRVYQSARGFSPTQSIFNSSQTVIYSCFGKLTHLNYSFINWRIVMVNFSPNKSFKGTPQRRAFASQILCALWVRYTHFVCYARPLTQR